jgi:methyl-accepting chemotaxis protein
VQQFVGDWREIMTGVNTILDEALEPVNVQVAALEAMAEGKLTQNIVREFKGDHNRGKSAINQVADLANQATIEIRRLIEASRVGDLKARAEVQQFVGDWRELMTGVNTILDEALEPVNVQAEVLARMAAGDLSALISAIFIGDHIRIIVLVNDFQDFNQQVV